MGGRVKAQVAVEFILLISFVFLIFLVFLQVAVNQLQDVYKEKEAVLLEDVAAKIQGEIFLAYNVKNGYSRDFDIPSNLGGIDYTLTIVQNRLIIETNNFQDVLDIPEVQGSLIKGSNTITKTGDIIYLNS